MGEGGVAFGVGHFVLVFFLFVAGCDGGRKVLALVEAEVGYACIEAGGAAEVQIEGWRQAMNWL